MCQSAQAPRLIFESLYLFLISSVSVPPVSNIFITRYVRQAQGTYLMQTECEEAETNDTGVQEEALGDAIVPTALIVIPFNVANCLDHEV